MKKKHIETVFLAFCAGLALAVPVRFTADVTQAATFQATAYRGETLEIEAALTDRGNALTNDAPATLYWQTNGMDTAWWTAPAAMSGGVIRATWSPTNDVGAASYRVFLGVTDGGLNYRANLTLRMTGSPGDSPNALPLPVSVLDFASVSATNAPWALPYTAGDNIVITNGVISSTATGGGGGIAEEYDPVWEAEKIGYLPLNNPWIVFDDSKVLMGRLGFNGTEKEIFAGQNGIYYSPFAPTTGDDEIAVKGDIPDISPLAPRQWVLDTIGGTNTWMAIDGEDLSICTSTNAASTNVLWQSSSGIGAAVSNLSQRVTQHTAQIAALQARPDLTSWGDYAPDGTANPDPDYMLYLNSPATVFGSGFSWEQSGAYFCLVQSGAVAFAASPGQGEVRFGLDSTNYFGIVQGGSATVGARVNSFSVADDVATLTVDYTGGDFPVCWFTGSLLTDFTEVTGTWVDNGDGSATGSFAATGTAGFYKLTTSVQLGARMHVNMPLKAAGGVVGTDAAAPVKYDSVITIQSNGHTYRIPAELVE